LANFAARAAGFATAAKYTLQTFRKFYFLTTPKVLPFRHVASIDPKPPEAQWLVQSLWAARGVGLIAARPKSLKTWLACELAVAVATGKEALGRFPVRDPGPVLVYAAEDDLPSMRVRFQSVADAREVVLKDAPIYLIDLPALHIDDASQLRRLRQTVASVRPRLLILDPFVRIVGGIDENSAQEVSSVLGSLRAIQREHDVAVQLIHHMRKANSAYVGQQLRGSGDFAAWTDSGLFIVRRGPSDLVLFVEHRGARAPPPMKIRLESEPTPHLVVEPEPPSLKLSSGPRTRCGMLSLRTCRQPSVLSPPSTFATSSRSVRPTCWRFSASSVRMALSCTPQRDGR